MGMTDEIKRMPRAELENFTFFLLGYSSGGALEHMTPEEVFRFLMYAMKESESTTNGDTSNLYDRPVHE